MIRIDYRSTGPDWTLSVMDDGVGIPTGPDAPKAGLGTGIVEALTKNLQAEIEITDTDPGTTVTVVHREETNTDVHSAV
jgi:two-component sensor histidine kinase